MITRYDGTRALLPKDCVRVVHLATRNVERYLRAVSTASEPLVSIAIYKPEDDNALEDFVRRLEHGRVDSLHLFGVRVGKRLCAALEVLFRRNSEMDELEVDGGVAEAEGYSALCSALCSSRVRQIMLSGIRVPAATFFQNLAKVIRTCSRYLEVLALESVRVVGTAKEKAEGCLAFATALPKSNVHLLRIAGVRFPAPSFSSLLRGVQGMRSLYSCMICLDHEAQVLIRGVLSLVTPDSDLTHLLIDCADPRGPRPVTRADFLSLVDRLGLPSVRLRKLRLVNHAQLEESDIHRLIHSLRANAFIEDVALDEARVPAMGMLSLRRELRHRKTDRGKAEIFVEQRIRYPTLDIGNRLYRLPIEVLYKIVSFL